MSKVLGVEIGSSVIRICEVDYKVSNPKVYQAISIKTPEGIVSDGEITVNEELLGAIKSALSAAKIKTRQLVFSMNSTKIASREVVVPYVKENKLAELIRVNASDFFPVDMDMYELGHNIISLQENEKGIKQYKVLVLAVPKGIVNSYRQLASGLGGTIVALDYSGNSIYQIIRQKCDVGVQMVVKVDEASTMLTILKDQMIVLQRTVSYGAEEAVEAIMGSELYGARSYEEAVEILHGSDCINGAEQEGSVAEKALSYLTNGIVRVVDYYNSRNAEEPIQKAYLTGFGSMLEGLDVLISGSTGVKFSMLKELEGLQLEKYFKDGDFGEYLTCIGAAIAPLGFLEEDKENKASVELVPSSRGMEKISILVLAGGLLIALALGGAGIFAYREQVKEKKQLETRKTELQPAEELYKTFLQQQYTYNKLTYFYNVAETPNAYLADFMEEMEQKMPSSINVDSFNADIAGVTMSVTVKDKKEVAKVLEQFRTFESVGTVTVDNISDSGAVMDGQPLEEEPKVSFSLVITYKGQSADEAEQTRQTEEQVPAEETAAE